MWLYTSLSQDFCWCHSLWVQLPWLDACQEKESSATHKVCKLWRMSKNTRYLHIAKHPAPIEAHLWKETQLIGSARDHLCCIFPFTNTGIYTLLSLSLSWSVAGNYRQCTVHSPGTILLVWKIYPLDIHLFILLINLCYGESVSTDNSSWQH